jgi:hypothetical protein
LEDAGLSIRDAIITQGWVPAEIVVAGKSKSPCIGLREDLTRVSSKPMPIQVVAQFENLGVLAVAVRPLTWFFERFKVHAVSVLQ